MSESPTDLASVFAHAGVDVAGIDAQQVEEAEQLLGLARKNPIKAVAQIVAARRDVRVAKGNCARAAESAGKLEELLDGLLSADPLLCRLEGLRREDGSARAVCRINGQLREMSIHPAVDLSELEALEPWEFALVRPEEMIVIGTHRDPELFARSQGEIVEFKGYHDRQRGLARVARQGQDEAIVSLAGPLRDVELTPPTKLVLLQGDERWAIGRIDADNVNSRFEVPVESIRTRFEDLAGLDGVIEPLIEDIIVRLVNPEVRERYGLRPLNGVLLYSYKPGMGKTALMRALAHWLHELGEERGFDVVLYVVKPNELKIVWHGGDARLVREELCGSILARQSVPRDRPLFQLVVLDEIDSLGKRAGGSEGLTSQAQNDAVQALLAEMDGMVQAAGGDGPPAHVLWCGMTNRPDMLDDALKRPGRFGDLVLEMPEPDRESAEGILSLYSAEIHLPWFVDEEIRTDLDNEELRASILRPAVQRVFDMVVMRYHTDGRAGIEVTAGEVMANVNFMEAMNLAKKRAARRELLGVGVAAVSYGDVVDGLIDQACSAAAQMDADRSMFVRQMKLKERVNRVDLVPALELRDHHYLRPVAGRASA